jgi:hypothetical protein
LEQSWRDSYRGAVGAVIDYGSSIWQEFVMSDAAAQLVDAFVALPPQERYAVLLELARLSEESGPVSDEELTQAGAEIFAMYDREESEDVDAETR